MSVYDNTDVIQASANLAWKEAYKLARKGRIEIEEKDSILFASHLKYGYVYIFKERPDGTTKFRHLIDSEVRVREALEGSQDPWSALDDLTANPEVIEQTELRKTTSSILGGVLSFLGVSDEDQKSLSFLEALPEMGEAQFKRVRKRAERAAKRA